MADKKDKPPKADAPAGVTKGEKHPADDIFNQYDKDNSGALDKKEVEAAIKDFCKQKGKKKPNPLMVMAAFKLFDKDGSGEIDREEFRQMVDKVTDSGKKAGEKGKAEAEKQKAAQAKKK